MMNGRGESDSAIVAGKPTNKAERSAAEPVEPRAGAEGNASWQSTHRAQYRVTCVTGAGTRAAGLPLDTQGGSRVREFRSRGSVRGRSVTTYREPKRAQIRSYLSAFRATSRADTERWGYETSPAWP